MAQKGKMGRVDDTLEVAHITGVQGIRAAMEVLAREADRTEDNPARKKDETEDNSPREVGGSGAEGKHGRKGEEAGCVDPRGGGSMVLPTEVVHAPRPVKTCAVCAAENEGTREFCWNCGASLRRVR